MQKTVWLYLLIIGAAALGLITILHFGRHQFVAGNANNPVASQPSQHGLVAPQASLGNSVEERLIQNAQDPLSRFFLQLFAIITVSYSVGWFFTRCGQPAVVGEMMAGVLLGPSLFGLLAPGAFQYVFAPASLEPLHLLSQIGVCLFMFAVGMEMDWAELREKASAAVLISHTSIAIPSLLGVGVAYLLYERLAQTWRAFRAVRSFCGDLDEYHRLSGARADLAGPPHASDAVRPDSLHLRGRG